MAVLLSAIRRRRPRLSLPSCGFALYGGLLLLLAVHFLLWLRYALAAIHYPFGLDYGEGIVWQQALLIPGERMYGDINTFPFIVFHYPPLFHLAVRAVAALGSDPLAAGRGISVVSTLAIGVLAAALARDVSRDHVPYGAGLVGALVAGLSIFLYPPVVLWSPLMRVDMLAIALSLLGVWLAGRSGAHPRLLYVAVLAFVLAVYTKQSCLAAPVAVLLVYLIVDPRTAMKAYGIGLLVGLTALLALTWMTNGGFLRHLLLYNLNRYSFHDAAVSLLAQWPYIPFLALALGGLAAGWNHPAAEPAATFLQSVRSSARQPIAVLTLYLAFSTGTLLTLGKSGASVNYLIETMCVCSVLIGVLVASSVTQIHSLDGKTGALLLPLVLLVLALSQPAAPEAAADRTQQLGALVSRIAAAQRPVLSDDMVLLLRAGRSVPWEPAIFAELASTGRWDERRITDMITAHDFAFVIIQEQRGSGTYDSRFTPGVDQAIHAAYPRIEEYAGRTLHLPPD